MVGTFLVNQYFDRLWADQASSLLAVYWSANFLIGTILVVFLYWQSDGNSIS